MEAPQFSGVVRVTASRDDIEEATRVGVEKLREGYSPEALVLAVDEVLHNTALSRAIVIYLQSEERREAANSDRQRVWLTVFSWLVFAGFCCWVVYDLLQLVLPDSSFLTVILIVMGQGILLRLALKALRHAFIASCDGLNDESYPTRLHPIHHASPIIGNLRLRRLSALIRDTADRIIHGERAGELTKQLAEVNLTPPAARLLVWMAKLRATTREYLPPYEQAWLGYTLATVFIVTCLIFIERSGDRLAEGYQNYAIGITGWIAGDIAARPRRRRNRRGPKSGKD